MRRRDLLRSGLIAPLAALPWRVRAARGPQVIVCGGGFAGGGCALAIRRLAPEIRVTLIDPQPRYVTCPMSDSVIVQLRSLASITVTRAGLERAGVRYLRDSVDHIDSDTNRVRLRGGTTLGYERLVVAPGIRLLFGEPAGYEAPAAQRMPHAWEGGASTMRLASALRDVPDGGTVAISVPSGLMRCPPGPYERASLLAFWLSAHRRRCKLLIFDANNHFPRQELFSAAWAELYPGMIEWIAPGEGGAVSRVDAPGGVLYSSSGAHHVDLANIIPPQAPGELALRNGLCAGRGWCPVDPLTFESQHARHVHVIGDACIAGAMPKSASAALSQARQCASAICAALAGKPTPAAELDSVCYSLLGPGRALVMRGRFAAGDSGIQQLDTGSPPPEGGSELVDEAATWYQRIRAECFAT